MSRQEAVTVVGAGLAGCEAAWQLARRNIPVVLYEMKPLLYSPAHHLPGYAELVCSNSLRSVKLENAAGLLKEEMRHLGSLIIECAEKTALPAGGALAVDRELFSELVTRKIQGEKLISTRISRVDHIPRQGICIIATGPLTDEALFLDIQACLGDKMLHFHDAAAPIVLLDSIDQTIAFRQSRYGHGGDDYVNCPMNRDEYDRFHNELVHAQKADLHDFDLEIVFEGCMPIETMAARGYDTIRHGPLKPVGLVDPRTGRKPFACVQLRQDNRAASLFNMVGFQTRLKIPEQQRVFRLIPGLGNAVFIRYGMMHRNSYLDSPKLLDPDYSVRNRPDLYFAGQITGVEGYIESASSGLLAGIQAAKQATGWSKPERARLLPSSRTVIGALAHYISDSRIKCFKPMNANYGIVEITPDIHANREARLRSVIERSLFEIDRIPGMSYNEM